MTYYIKDKHQKAKRTYKKYSRKSILKIVFRVFLVILAIGGLIYLFFFSPIFEIKNFIIDGKDPILENELTEYLKPSVSGKNYFFVSKKKILSELEKDYRIKDAEATKIFPDSLKITFKKSLPFALIYIKGGEESFLYWVRNQIYVIPQNSLGERSLTVLAEQDIPIIYDQTNISIKTKEWQELFMGLSRLLSFYGLGSGKQNNFTINFIEIKKEGGRITLEIITNEGWKILADPVDLISQFERMEAILTKEVKSRADLLYVDLRFGETVFYKTK
jgi:hypothetical protein